MKAVLLVAALVAAAVVHAALDGDAGIGTWLRLRGEIDALAAEAASLERGGFAIERAIREELGFARAHETLVRLSRDDDSSARFP